MATIIYPNMNDKSYFNMDYGHESVRASSSQGINKMIAVKSNSNNGDRIHKSFLLSRHYPVVEIIPAIQGPKPKALALIKIDAISRRKKTSWQQIRKSCTNGRYGIPRHRHSWGRSYDNRTWLLNINWYRSLLNDYWGCGGALHNFSTADNCRANPSRTTAPATSAPARTMPAAAIAVPVGLCIGSSG
jgi:hypothetical protein